MVNKILNELNINYKFYYTIAYRHLHDHQDTQDVMQNVMLRAATHCPADLAPKKLRAWLAVICCNESKSMLSARRRQERSDSALVQDEDSVSNYGNPDEMAFYYENITNAAILLAPAEYRGALYEYYTEGVPLLNAAQKHGIPESNLRYWRKKIEKKLREFL